MSANRNRSGNKQWPHPPEALLSGQLTYSVKFYGMEDVDQPKGTEPVKEAIQKIKLKKQERKENSGRSSSPRVELVISSSGVAIQDRKTKATQYQFPLHHISYCADDKAEKKLLSFIANDHVAGKHHCFVLGSEHSAEEITLTIGQAFDLAYRKYLDLSEKELNMQKQISALQQHVMSLQLENARLKRRVTELEQSCSHCNEVLAKDSIGAVATFDASHHLQSSGSRFPSSEADSSDTIKGIKPGLPTSAAVQPASDGNLQVNGPAPAVDAFGMESFYPKAAGESRRDLIQLQARLSQDLWLGDKELSLGSFDPLT